MSSHHHRRTTAYQSSPPACTVAGNRGDSRTAQLAKLLPLWPHEIEDLSEKGRLLVITKLHQALRSERRRGRAGHWTYDVNRHIGLSAALKAEKALMKDRGGIARLWDYETSLAAPAGSGRGEIVTKQLVDTNAIVRQWQAQPE